MTSWLNQLAADDPLLAVVLVVAVVLWVSAAIVWLVMR